MDGKFSKTAITFEERAVRRNSFRLSTISMASIKRRMNEGNRRWTPRAVPSSVHTLVWVPNKVPTLVHLKINFFHIRIRLA